MPNTENTTTIFYPTELTEQDLQLYESLRLTDAEVSTIVAPPANPQIAGA